jgi:hypothetical protein
MAAKVSVADYFTDFSAMSASGRKAGVPFYFSAP